MKNIKSFTQLFEAGTFKKLNYNSHFDHNPDCDILEGHFGDYFITYGIYVNDKGANKKGDEFMEYYTGSNFMSGTDKKSHSRMYTADKIPAKYKAAWEELKKEYNANYKDKKASTRNEKTNEEELMEGKVYRAKFNVEDGSGHSVADWKRYIERSWVKTAEIKTGPSSYKHHKAIEITVKNKTDVNKVIKALRQFGIDWPAANDFEQVNESESVNENYGEELDKLQKAFDKVVEAMRGSSVLENGPIGVWLDFGVRNQFCDEDGNIIKK